MNVVLLSGGSGKRLWPLSNDIRSKQFLKLFRRADGTYESMLMRMVRGIREASPDARITIATGRAQISALKHQIGDDADLSPEPCRRDTFPAIALATAYLHDVKGVKEDEPVIVCPVDPYVDDSYFATLSRMGARAADGISRLIVMGIRPTYPSEKYGYLMPRVTGDIPADTSADADNGRTVPIDTFVEKPTEAEAKKLIEAGALWNGGVFAFRAGYCLQAMKRLTGCATYKELHDRYESLEKISFDYAVAEKETEITAVVYDGAWKDLGTWNTLTEAMQEETIGNALLSDTCDNVHVINDLDLPVFCMGLKDVVVAASPDGIIVSDKAQSSYIKPYIDRIASSVHYAEKSWGSFQVIDVSDQSMTIKVTLNAGHRMNYHSHTYRDETWTIIAGRGRAVVDGAEKEVIAGDVIRMPRGTKHTLIADTLLQAIEVQTGEDISVEDKEKHELTI